MKNVKTKPQRTLGLCYLVKACLAILFDQTVSGSSLKKVFSSTNVVHAKSVGALLKYSNLSGYSHGKTQSIWHSNSVGPAIWAGFSGSRYKVNFK